MKRVSFRIFGIEIWSLEVIDLEAVSDSDTSEDELTPGIGGGESHDFERDLSPIDPANRDPWEYDRSGGFGFRSP